MVWDNYICKDLVIMLLLHVHLYLQEQPSATAAQVQIAITATLLALPAVQCLSAVCSCSMLLHAVAALVNWTAQRGPNCETKEMPSPEAAEHTEQHKPCLLRYLSRLLLLLLLQHHTNRMITPLSAVYLQPESLVENSL